MIVDSENTPQKALSLDYFPEGWSYNDRKRNL